MVSVSKTKVSRRAFMTAAGLGAASVTLGGVNVTSAQAQEIEWDREADVIVVGSGGAGLSAATGAIDNGGSVIVLEKGPIIGGTTGKSGGGSWVPNNHHMQAAGLRDDRETYLRYCARVSYPELYRPDHPTLGLHERTYRLFEVYWDNASV